MAEVSSVLDKWTILENVLTNLMLTRTNVNKHIAQLF